MHSGIDLQESEDESREEFEEEIQEAIAESINETINEEELGGTYAERSLRSFEDQITDRLGREIAERRNSCWRTKQSNEKCSFYIFWPERGGSASSRGDSGRGNESYRGEITCALSWLAFELLGPSWSNCPPKTRYYQI